MRCPVFAVYVPCLLHSSENTAGIHIIFAIHARRPSNSYSLVPAGRISGLGQVRTAWAYQNSKNRVGLSKQAWPRQRSPHPIIDFLASLVSVARINAQQVASLSSGWVGGATSRDDPTMCALVGKEQCFFAINDEKITSIISYFSLPSLSRAVPRSLFAV